MDSFVAAALVLGGLALARYAVSLPLFLAYLRRARVRSIPAGPTPPLSVLVPLRGRVLEENLVPMLRQNYPEFEVIFLVPSGADAAREVAARAAKAVPDVAVRFLDESGEAEARFDLLVRTAAQVRPDPLWLRDVANGLAEADAVTLVPVVFGPTTARGRAAALLADTEGFLTALVARPATATLGFRRGKEGERPHVARRAARVHVPGGFLDVARAAPHLSHWSYLPLAFAPLLLLLAGFLTPHAIWMLGLHTAARALVAVLVDFRFCWDRTLVRALPLLPLLWILEPAVMTAGSWRVRPRATLGEG